MDLTDQATTIRAGEELDVSRVQAFLKQAIPGLAGSLTIRQFPGGFSNLTYLLRFKNRELVLRRPPFGTKAKTAHDMNREYRILTALRPVFPYCPEPLAYNEDPAVMGCPFYVMERIKGIILRKDLPPDLKLTPDQVRKLFEKVLDVLVELHSIDYKKIGLESFGKPEGYVRRQVEGWSKRYRAARTPDAPDFETVMAWIAEKMPPDTDRPTIVHNDYRLDNMVLDERDPFKIIGVLDWEMATIGDPLMDLGNTLAYWVEKDDPPESHLLRNMPTHMDGALTRKEVAARYAQKTGRSLARIDFYHCFGIFRLAVIAQQIYYRFYHGQTRDARFQTLIHGVRILEQAALRILEQKRSGIS
jgi:aminoglycoside phosphotransferase (APT) family kinase protein